MQHVSDQQGVKRQRTKMMLKERLQSRGLLMVENDISRVSELRQLLQQRFGFYTF